MDADLSPSYIFSIYKKDVKNAAVQWFSPGTPVSSTNKTNCHNITEILLKVTYLFFLNIFINK
jgi:spore coat protein CotF